MPSDQVVEFVDGYDESFWYIYAPSVQIALTSSVGGRPDTSSTLNTNFSELEVRMPSSTRVLAGRMTRPWDTDFYDDSKRAGTLDKATETIIVQLSRQSRTPETVDAEDGRKSDQPK